LIGCGVEVHTGLNATRCNQVGIPKPSMQNNNKLPLAANREFSGNVDQNRAAFNLLGN